MHDVAHARARLRREEFAKRHDAHEALLFVQDVHVVERLEFAARLLPQIRNRFVDRHLGADAGEAGAHEAPGLVLGVSEERVYFLARRVVEKRQEAVPFGHGRGFLNQVSGVVRREHAHPGAPSARG